MGFWTRTLGIDGIRANMNPPSSVGAEFNPGDPEGIVFDGFDEIPEARSLPWVQPSPWDGWPQGWSTPNFVTGQVDVKKLVDVAWSCLDLNSSILSSMPVYRLRDGRVMEPTTWMANPDPDIYSSWNEFAKQLFWDYMMGEAFVLPMLKGADKYPLKFRVIPPFMIDVEMKNAKREYKLGPVDVTDEILHIRYHSSTINPRGMGPLDVAGLRTVAIGLLQKYVNNLAETGGVPLYWLEIERKITKSEAVDLMDSWIESRAKYAGHPAMVGSGAKLNQAKSMSAQDMSLMELTQFNEARIAVLLGVPPFLVGLPGATGSLTYSNIEQLFSFHDRSSLRPKANAAMSALSLWALPGPQSVELNRDDYTRPTMVDRYTAYKAGIEAGFLTIEEVRAMERLHGDAAAIQLSGGGD